MQIGKVVSLFTKLEKGKPVIPTSKLNVVESFGIQDDANASNTNPRHVLITSNQTLCDFNLNPGQLKENIVVEDFDIDSLKSGEELKIGDVKLRILFMCEPCGYVESLKKGLLKEIEGKRGVLTYVKTNGTIKLGDSVSKTKTTYPQVPYKIFDRFVWMLKKVPSGKVITFTDLVEGLGLFSAYFRVIPAYIKRVQNTNLPIHRIVDSKGNLIQKYVANQNELLSSEGVSIKNNTVINLEKYRFNLKELY